MLLLRSPLLDLQFTADKASAPAPAVATIFGQPATTSANTGNVFGQPATTSASTGSVFGQPSNVTGGLFSSSFGQGGFGQPTSTTANAPLFGQSSFSQPAQAAVSSFGSASVFGQPRTAATGLSAESVFGQVATSTTSPIKPLFGGTAFGQSPVNAAGTTAAPSQGFGTGMFGNMGLEGTPNAANANRNAFGGGTVVQHLLVISIFYISLLSV